MNSENEIYDKIVGFILKSVNDIIGAPIKKYDDFNKMLLLTRMYHIIKSDLRGDQKAKITINKATADLSSPDPGAIPEPAI